MEINWNYLPRIRFFILKYFKGLMSIFMFRIPIYTFKWLFVAKIYIIYEYRIITIGLYVNKLQFYIFEFFFKFYNCHFQTFIQWKYNKS